MLPIVIVSGPPGSGKTTACGLLAQADPQGLHLPSDLFYGFPAHHIPPYRPQADAQNAAVIRAVCRSAASFAADGYRVYLDGIFGPWFLPLIAAQLQAARCPAAYALLDIGLDEALARVEQRSGPGQASMVRTMHDAFRAAGSLAGHRIVTAGRPAAEIADEIAGRLQAGALALDLARWAPG